MTASPKRGVTTLWHCRSWEQVLWALHFPRSELKDIYTEETEELTENKNGWCLPSAPLGSKDFSMGSFFAPSSSCLSKRAQDPHTDIFTCNADIFTKKRHKLCHRALFQCIALHVCLAGETHIHFPFMTTSFREWLSYAFPDIFLWGRGDGSGNERMYTLVLLNHHLSLSNKPARNSPFSSQLSVLYLYHHVPWGFQQAIVTATGLKLSRSLCMPYRDSKVSCTAPSGILQAQVTARYTITSLLQTFT